MKKRIALFFSIIIAVILIIPAFSDETQRRFVDNSGTCSYEDVKRINDYLDLKSESLSFEITALIENSINGRDIQDYADIYYENNFVIDSDGILFVLVLDTREWAFSTSGNGIGIFNENDFNSLINSMYSDLKSGDYASAMETYALNSAEYVKWVKDNASDISQNGYSYNNNTVNSGNRERILFDTTRLLWCAIIGCITGLIVVSSMKKKMNTVHQSTNAFDYVRKNSFKLTRSNDLFLTSSVTRTLRQTQTPRSGSSHHSGGHTHSSSSGHSHGGSHGRF